MGDEPEAVACGLGGADAPARRGGARVIRRGGPQQHERQAGLAGREMQPLARLEVEFRRGGADRGRRLRPQRLLHGPERLLVVARPDQDQPGRIEAELLQAVSMRPAVIGERAMRGDEQQRSFCGSMIFSDLPSPAEALSLMHGWLEGFAQAGNRSPLFGIMLSRQEARQQGDEKTEGRGGVARAVRRDFVQRADREAAVRQMCVDRGETERQHARCIAVAFQARQQAAQLVDDVGAVSAHGGKRRGGHGYAVRTNFSDPRS